MTETNTQQHAAEASLYALHPDLSRLQRAIRRSENRFALYFVRCNVPSYRQRLLDALRNNSDKTLLVLNLETEFNGTLDSFIASQLQTVPSDAVVCITGIEHRLPRQQPEQQTVFIRQLNWRRSAYARLQHTLIFWLPEYALQILSQEAPDFYDWYSGLYEFDVPETEQAQEIQQRLQEFYQGEAPAANRLSAEEKQRWITVLENLLAAKPAIKEQARLANELGRLYYSLGQYEQALPHYQQALQYSQDLGDKSGKRATLNNISQIYKARGDYDTALDYLQHSLSIRQEIDDKPGEGATLSNIAGIYHARGNYDTALDYLQHALKLTQEICDKSGEGVTLNNISQIYDAQGDYNIALDYLQRALKLAQKLGDKSVEGTTLNNISKIYKARGDTETALDYLQRSLAIAQKIGDKSVEGTILNNISQIYKARGDYDTALDYLQRSFTIAQKIGNVAGMCPTLFNIGRIHLQNEQRPEAVQAFVRVYQLANQIQLAEALQALETLARALGQEEGLEYWAHLAEKMEEE